MDPLGNMPGEANYSLNHRAPARVVAAEHGETEEYETAVAVESEEELVGAAVFLSGRGSSFINGHTLYVDGGITTCL